MHKIIDSIKYIKVKDLFAPFIFVLSIIPALFYKAFLAIRKKPLWLICEDGNTARDNGYYFYKYMLKEHPEVNCKYVIRKSSDAYKKIIKLGRKPIQTSSFAHYVSYLAAKWNISNHKKGNPNQPLFYVLHVNFNLINNRVFLQHGITYNKSEWLFYNKTKFRYFICGAKREYDFVKNNFGYPEDNVVFTGFARFDTLVDNSRDKKQILIMPTWRNWLGRETNVFYKKENFKKTKYYNQWNGLLINKNFIKYIEENKIKVLFYPHQWMQKFIDDFEIKSKNIHLVQTDLDIQKALRDSYLMITDYSSVYMDFAYMTKPIIYFQFDEAEFRRRQLKKGYFDCVKEGFGPVITSATHILDAIIECRDEKNRYEERCKNFFQIRDKHNCERIYKILAKNEQGK